MGRREGGREGGRERGRERARKQPRCQGSQDATGKAAEADGSSVPVTAIVHVVPRPCLLTRRALVRPVRSRQGTPHRRCPALVVAPPRRPARRLAALRLVELAARPAHAVPVPAPPRLRPRGAELRAARARLFVIAPAAAVIAVIPARPLLRRRRLPAALVLLASGTRARLPRWHVAGDLAHCRARSVVECVLARCLAAHVRIAPAIRAHVMILRAPRGATGGGALAGAAGVAVVAPARRPALRVAALIRIAHAIGARVIFL